MTRSTDSRTLRIAYEDGRLTRRQFVTGALKMGFSVTGAAALLAACHSGGHKAAPKPLSGRVQILVGFDGGNTAPERQIQQALAQAFIAANPHVGIDFLRATSAAAAETQLSALVERSAAPDIVLGIDLADVSRFADQHLWLDLHPLFSRDGVSTGAFVSQAMAAAQLTSYYGSTKAIPGVPLGIHDHALAYNSGLFTKDALPTPPTSWTDDNWSYSGTFLQAAQLLTLDRTGKHAGEAGFDPTHITQFGAARLSPEAIYFSFGGQLYDPAKRQALFNTPAAIQGAQFAGDLVAKYHVVPTAAQLAALAGAAGAADPEQAAWRAGKLAMIDLCSCEINSPFGLQVPFTWKPAAMPTGPAERIGHLDVSLGTIVAASGQRDLAWEVLKFFAVDPANEVQTAYGSFGAMPALSANQNAFAQGTQKSLNVDPSVWVAGLPKASTENDAWIPAFVDVHNLFSAALAQVASGMGAATVMPQLQQQAQAAIDAWFKANKLPT